MSCSESSLSHQGREREDGRIGNECVTDSMIYELGEDCLYTASRMLSMSLLPSSDGSAADHLARTIGFEKRNRREVRELTSLRRLISMVLTG